MCGQPDYGAVKTGGRGVRWRWVERVCEVLQRPDELGKCGVVDGGVVEFEVE